MRRRICQSDANKSVCKQVTNKIQSFSSWCKLNIELPFNSINDIITELNSNIDSDKYGNLNDFFDECNEKVIELSIHFIPNDSLHHTRVLCLLLDVSNYLVKLAGSLSITIVSKIVNYDDLIDRIKKIYIKLKEDNKLLEEQCLLPSDRCGGIIVNGEHSPCIHRLNLSPSLIAKDVSPSAATASLAHVLSPDKLYCVDCERNNLINVANNSCNGIEGNDECIVFMNSNGLSRGAPHYLNVCLECILDSKGFCCCPTCELILING